MKQYKQQPSLEQFLKDNVNMSKKDYNEIFVGRYRGHHRKIKRMFNNPNIKLKSQVSSSMSRKILSPTDKGGWTTSDAWSNTSF